MKKITLTNGQETLVDDEDYAYLNQFVWYACKSRPTARPVRRMKTDQRSMSRLLYHDVADRMGLVYDCIDHVNGDSLDNRRCNLRPATTSQNLHNRGAPSHNTSGVKGVSFDKHTGRYDARIMVDRKSYWLGRFDTLAEAKLAVDTKRVELVGDFACT